MSSRPRQWIVSQIGSREHYAAPRAFAEQGVLDQFYTDIWCRFGRSLVRRLPREVSALANRYHAHLPGDKVTSFNAGGLRRIVGARRAKDITAVYDGFNETGKWFCERVNASLQRRLKRQAAPCDCMLYSTGALETLQFLKNRGIFRVLDQLDPAQTDEQIVREECDKWAGWEAQPGRVPQSYYDRLRQEWELADLIIVNSNWSRTALTNQGIDETKIEVVPLAYEPEQNGNPPARSRKADGEPLRVLWLGQIVLRKGIPYLFDAARRLLGENIQFTVAGRVGISEAALQTAPANVHVAGKVPRDRALQLYRDADVFVLPTMSDGFAITQLEAMSFGLPVITTPRCGDVVTHGSDGYIVPAGDAGALAEALSLINTNRDRLALMSVNATATSRKFTLSRFATTIQSAVETRRRS